MRNALMPYLRYNGWHMSLLKSAPSLYLYLCIILVVFYMYFLLGTIVTNLALWLQYLNKLTTTPI